MDLDGVQRLDPSTVTGEAQESAVVVPVVDREEPHLLFTKRAEHLSNHPGQMSFPGGRREPEDRDLRETAVREADEEVCLEREELCFVGRLDDIRTVTNFSVRPFVARAPDREYVPCEHEVADVAVLPLRALTERDNYYGEYRKRPHHDRIRVHYFYVGGYTVWGATARILAQFLELTTAWETPDVDDVVDADADYPL